MGGWVVSLLTSLLGRNKGKQQQGAMPDVNLQQNQPQQGWQKDVSGWGLNQPSGKL